MAEEVVWESEGRSLVGALNPTWVDKPSRLSYEMQSTLFGEDHDPVTQRLVDRYYAGGD